MTANYIVIIPKSHENQLSTIDTDKTWLELAQSLLQEQGGVIHRKKDAIEYLCLQTDLSTNDRASLPYPLLTISEYFSHGWDVYEEPEGIDGL